MNLRVRGCRCEEIGGDAGYEARIVDDDAIAKEGFKKLGERLPIPNPFDYAPNFVL